MAQTVQAKLVLVGHSAFPTRDTWHTAQNEFIDKIRIIQAMEASGAEVLVMQADVTEFFQMQAVVEQVKTQFGQIHGVIHAAGVPAGGVIQRKTSVMTENILTPKITGARVLQDIFENDALDFLVFCSSLTAILEVFGQVDYCSANAFLDIYAHQLRNQGIPAISINWDAWQTVGMAANADVPVVQQEQLQKMGILPEEGIDVFSCILSNPFPQVVVSTCDFLERIQLNKVVQSSVSEEITPPTQQVIHSRPTLSNVYTPPRNEIEQTLVELWQNVLGIGQIGIFDDFFELGGHSLLATQLISRIREKLMVELPLAHLFESPTIASLAEYITIKHLAKQTFQVFETLASEDEEGVL